MEKQLLAIIIFFLAVNTASFLAMFWDKRQSRRAGAERISEGLLFFWATIFGSVGVYAGMLAFRHKTQKWYFIVGVPFLMAQNVAFLYLAYAFFNGRV